MMIWSIKSCPHNNHCEVKEKYKTNNKKQVLEIVFVGIYIKQID